MSKRSSILIGLLLFLFPIISFAGKTYQQRYNESFQNSYELTLKMCHPQKWGDKVAIGKYAIKGFLAGIWPDEMQDIYRLSPETQGLIDNPRYWDAMESCYGLNESLWMTFTTSLLVADAMGHTVGLALPFKVFNAVSKWLKGTKWAVQHPKVLKTASQVNNGLTYAAVATVLAQRTYMYYQLYRMKKNPQNLLDGLAEQGAEAIDSTVSLLRLRLVEITDEMEDSLTTEARRRELSEQAQQILAFLQEVNRQLPNRV